MEGTLAPPESASSPPLVHLGYFALGNRPCRRLGGSSAHQHDRWLGSLTTPVNPPDVVVCAFSSLAKEIVRRKAESSKRPGRNLIEPLQQHRSSQTGDQQS